MAESFSFEEASKPIASGPESFSFEEAYTPDVPSNKPKLEVTQLGAGAASAGEAALATPAALYGAGVGASLGGAVGGAPGAVVGGITGAVVTGIAAQYGITSIEGAIDSVFGTNIVETRQKQQKQYPLTSLVGQVAGGGVGPGSTFGLAKEAINIGGRQIGKFGQAGIGAGIGVGVGAAQRAATGGNVFDIPAIAADIVGGGATRTTALGQRIIGAGERLVPPKPGIDPKQDAAYKTQTELEFAQIEKQIKEKEKTNIKGAVFREKDTGKIIDSGKKHDEELKKNPNLEAGFIDGRGEFLTRKEAEERAFKTGQLDTIDERFAPEEGLHSGDIFRKEDSLYRRLTDIQNKIDEAETNPGKYTPEELVNLKDNKSVLKDKMTIEKLKSIENPVLRRMAIEAGTDDVAMHGGNIQTVGALVSHLKNKFGTNHYISNVLDVLSNVDPNMTVNVLPTDAFRHYAEMNGFSKKTPAYWNEQGIWLEEGRGTNAIIAAHEIGHAATAMRIEQIRALPVDHPEAIRLKKLVSNIEDILTDVKSKVDLDKLTLSSRDKLEYALSNIHEFISDGVFNPSVMQQLLAIDRVAPKLGFVDKILKAVSDFFNLNPKQYTALHDLIESVSKLTEADVPKNLDPPGLFTFGSRESDDIQKDLGKEGIAATHDSPHRFSGDFDWIQNVGKGQGAAAKGVGTYLSSGDDVHRNYKKEFTDKIEEQRADAEGYKLKFGLFDTQTITKTKDYFAFKVWKTIKQHEGLFNYGKNRKNTREDAIASVKQDLKDLNLLDNDVELRAYYDKQLQEINKKRWTKAYEYVRPKAPGFEGDVSPTYHVTINANPDHIMSWDKPLKEQSEYVQQKLNSFIDPDSFAPVVWEKGADREVLGYPNRKGETLKTYVRGVKEPVEIAQVGFDGAVDDASTYMIKIPLSLSDKYYNTGEVFGSVKEAQAEFAAMHKESFGSAATPETTVGQLYNSMVRDFEATAKREGKGDISEREAQIKTTLQLLNKGIVGHRFNSAGGQNAKYPNYVIFKDSVIETNAVTFKDKPRELAGRGASPESESIKYEDKPGSDLEIWKQKILRLDKKISASEKESDPDTWTPHERNVFESGDWKEFSRLRGYSEEEIKVYQEYLDAVQEGTDKYGWSRDDIQSWTLFGTESGRPTLVTGVSAKDSSIVVASKSIDPNSIANEAEFQGHVESIYLTEGREAALEFFTTWKQHKAKTAIPVPSNTSELADAFHKINVWESADSAEFRVKHETNTNEGVTSELREQLFRAREGEIPMTPELKALEEKILASGDKEIVALLKKARKLTGDERALREFETGQARYRVFSPRDRTWKDFWDTKNPLGDKVAEEASGSRERSVFQLDDGKVIQLKRNEKTGATAISIWKDNKQRLWTTVQMGDKRLSAGDTIPGTRFKITDGQVHNIEANTPFRYLKDAEATQYMKLIELRKMTRDLELIDNLKQSNFFDAGRSPDTPLHEIPKDYVVPNNIDKIPQLRGWMFDSKTAAVIEDFAKVWDNNLLMKLSSQLIKNMMLNPLPHMMNEVAHLWNLRGLSGWVLPNRIADLAITGKRAWTDVATQSPFYREVMREGGTALGADPRNNAYWDQIGKDSVAHMVENVPGIKNMLKGIGYTTVDFYNAWSKNSSKAMWFTRDVMYTQAVHEVMDLAKRRGEPIKVKEAIKRVEEHMPNYRIPTEVAGSRMLSKTLQNPNISIFARYHYGMLKSIGNIIKEVDPRNLKSVEGRKEFKQGVDSALAAAVAMTIIYPLLDVLAEQVFGPDSKLRRAGPFHLIDAVENVVSGEKDPSALIWPVFTFNPALLTLAQLVFNKVIFTGKPVYQPNDPAKVIAGDVGSYLAKSVPQISTGIRAQEEGGAVSAIAKQFDIQTPTEKQMMQRERAKKNREKSRKSRETQRNKKGRE